jgi:hypothetical protein
MTAPEARQPVLCQVGRVLALSILGVCVDRPTSSTARWHCLADLGCGRGRHGFGDGWCHCLGVVVERGDRHGVGGTTVALRIAEEPLSQARSLLRCLAR